MTMLLESKALLSINFFHKNLSVLKIQTVIKSHSIMTGSHTWSFALYEFIIILAFVKL